MQISISGVGSHVKYDTVIMRPYIVDLGRDCTDCEQLVSMIAAGAEDSSLSVRIPTAAAVAALSEALRAQPPEEGCHIRLDHAARSTHLTILSLKSAFIH